MRSHTAGPPPPLTVSRKELLINGSDVQFRKLVHDLFGFLARHEAIRSGHAKIIGLMGIEYTILISIAHLASLAPVNIKAVATHLHVSATFVTRMIKKLEQIGFVKKTASPEDKRSVHLTLTSRGMRALTHLAPHQRRVNDIEFGTLSAREFTVLVGLTERLVTSSERALELQQQLRKDGRKSRRPDGRSTG